MATYTQYSTNDNEVAKQWAKSLYYGVMKRTTLFNPAEGLVSKDGTNLVHEKTELTKNPGDRVRITLLHQLAGAGVQGSNILEGKEEGIESATFDLVINKLRHGVRTQGEITDQRVSWDTMKEGKTLLADWYASRLDISGFTHLCGWNVSGFAEYLDQAGEQIDGTDTRYTGNIAVEDPDDQHIIRATGATDTAVGADNTAVMTGALLDKAVAKAKTLAVPIRPIKIRGGKYYVCFLHPFQVQTLRDGDSDWFAAMQAGIQGGRVDDNPIFTGALGMWNGVVYKESTYVSPGVASSAGVSDTRRAVLCGAQALGFANGKGYGGNRMRWVHGDWDHGDKYFASAAKIFGLASTRFKERGSSTIRDYGKIIITTYAENI